MNLLYHKKHISRKTQHQSTKKLATKYELITNIRITNLRIICIFVWICIS